MRELVAHQLVSLTRAPDASTTGAEMSGEMSSTSPDSSLESSMCARSRSAVWYLMNIGPQ